MNLQEIKLTYAHMLSKKFFGHGIIDFEAVKYLVSEIERLRNDPELTLKENIKVLNQKGQDIS